jgi:hypothetical protein
MMKILEDLGIAERILGITCDNASNNTTLIHEMEKVYHEKYPNAGFSLVWNKFECFAHVLNIGVQDIFKNFKNPNFDADKYEPGSSSNDTMVTALSKLAFLCRKIRKSPKLRRMMEYVSTSNEFNMKYLV